MKYESPQMQLILLEQTDIIISTSNPSGLNDFGEDDSGEEWGKIF